MEIMTIDEIESLGWKIELSESTAGLNYLECYYLTTPQEETYRLTVSDNRVVILHKMSVRKSLRLYDEDFFGAHMKLDHLKAIMEEHNIRV